MNLGELRSAIFSQADWSPKQSADAKSRVTEFVNRAYFQLVQEAPFLFFEKRVGFATLEDIGPNTTAILSATPGSTDVDAISVDSNDPWVFQRDLPNTTAGLALWDVTGRWRGRMILIRSASGAVQSRRMIRDIWNHDVGGGVLHQRISLFRPWNNLTDANMDFRIYMEDYYLPDNVMEVNSIRLFKDNQNWPLEVVGQLEAEYYSFGDSPNQVAQGVPRAAFRRYHRQIESPTDVPVGTFNAVVWQGPEPAGKFEYCFTYSWGYRSGDYRDFGPALNYAAAQTEPSRKEPLWESSPSPAVAITSVAGVIPDIGDPPGGTGSIVITTPDIDYMQGFGRKMSSGTGVEDPRYRHSGWRKRIYRRRHTVDSASYSAITAANQFLGAVEQETPDAFYLIGDIPGYQTEFVDNGNPLPDYHRRLREIHGYQSIRMYPRPNNKYDVDVRCLLRPEKLVDDGDVPEIHPDGMNVLLYKAISYLYESQGNIPLADRALQRYSEALFSLTKRYGDLRYSGQPLLKRPARAGRSTNSRRPWRRWYNLPSS